jgi:hypothetical protein
LWVVASDGFWDQGTMPPPPRPGTTEFADWVKERMRTAKQKTFDNISVLMIWTPHQAL